MRSSNYHGAPAPQPADGAASQAVGLWVKRADFDRALERTRAVVERSTAERERTRCVREDLEIERLGNQRAALGAEAARARLVLEDHVAALERRRRELRRAEEVFAAHSTPHVAPRVRGEAEKVVADARIAVDTAQAVADKSRRVLDKMACEIQELTSKIDERAKRLLAEHDRDARRGGKK